MRAVPPLREFYWAFLGVLVFAAHAVLAQAPPAPTGIFIRGGGYSDFFLLRDANTTEESAQLGDLFAKLWQDTTGHAIQIGPENVDGLINVGLGAEAVTTDLFPKPARENIGAEGYFYRTFSPSPRFTEVGAGKYLVIAGNHASSTRTGIYGFFRNAFECEWFAPGVNKMRRPGFQMETLKQEVVPAFRFREVATPPDASATATVFRTAHGLRPVSLGAALGHDSSLALIAPELHAKGQPGFFAEQSGQRSADALGDLCPSAEGLVDAIVASIREAIDTPESADEYALLKLRRARAGWLAQDKIWALSPMRGVAPCACAACVATAEREQSPVAPWLGLVNRVAVALDAAFSGEGYRVLTHAEGVRLSPPATLHPEENVIVMLSTEGCDFSTSFAKSKLAANEAFSDALQRWSRLSDHIWVADSLGRQSDVPAHFANLAVLQENLQFYTQHHAQGVILLSGTPLKNSDDFSALRYFLGARMLWDPDLNAEVHIERFFAEYYGKAAAPVRAYWEALGPHGVPTPNGAPSQAQREAMAGAQATLLAARGDLPEAVWARVLPLLPAAP